ncbi:deoxyguanosinetriphosphate triphosphohydrolase [Chloroflexota bacterium]
MNEKLNIRQYSEGQEEISLSYWAAKSRHSKGRERPEVPCPIRTEFQRDRDRVIHCNSFRRLKHKTQVFLTPSGDHYVTRLTHTLEVSQIARTISVALGLNEYLTEAIALGHDLGHTPFGHIGESVINNLYPGGFRHNEQSLRVVEKLENNGRGLNLTWEVRDGIINHSKGRGDITPAHHAAGTLEADVCRIADAIAYISHDIGDAVRSGLIADADLPVPAVATLGDKNSRRINTMVADIISRSWGVKDFDRQERPIIMMSPKVQEATEIMRDFLFKNVYDIHSSALDAKKARMTMRKLYNYFTANPSEIPPEYNLHASAAEQRAVDYIAGMTDYFAINLAENIG